MKIYLIAFKILTLIYTICLYFFDYLIVAIYHSQQAENKILIIRLDAIGDFILWLDSAQHFRKIYPDKKIVLLGNQVWTDIAKKFSYWDEVWELNRRKFYRNLPYRVRLLKKFRKAGFDIVIQPTYSREFLYGDAIVQISGARKKIGSVGDCSNIRPIEKKISNRFYTQLIPANPKPLMELRRNAEFVRGLSYIFQPSLTDIMPVAQGINNPVANNSPYFVLFPGASWTGKQWPIEKFSELSSLVFHETGMSAVICGGATERQLGEALIAIMDISVVNMVGETSLAELVAIIKDAQFLLGNDTSAVHIASAVSTPAFCILGGGHYGRFMPYDIEGMSDKLLPVPIIHRMDCFNCNWRCRYFIKDNEPAPCIEKISVEKVFAALQPLIKQQHQLGIIQ
ncbi:MAG: glycosyltransferase family 9 protein [Deltaproteobacteria bacterium]|nr:glycosyltransferase family 9 protein [Deltaproteobacteria bacterium]